MFVKYFMLKNYNFKWEKSLTVTSNKCINDTASVSII